MRYLGLARLLVGLSARAAYPMGAPLFFGILVVASILFGPTGMRAADVTIGMRASPPLAVVLWGGWLVLALPVARVALAPKEATYLRWLPAPRVVFYLAGGACALVVEGPWMLLFGRGEGLASALAAGLAALAGHALLATHRWRTKEGLAGLLAAVAAFHPRPAIALASSFFAASLAVASAIRKAPEAGAGARRGFLGRTPVGALAASHVHALVRTEPATVVRALGLATLAALVFPLAARGHDLETDASMGALALGLAAVAAPPGLSGVAATVLRAERSAAWLCDAAGFPPKGRAVAASLAMGMTGGVVGLGLGLGAALLEGARPALAARIVGLVCSFGVTTGAALATFAREAEVSPRRGDRGMVYALVWSLASALTTAAWGERALVVHFMAGAALVFWGVRRAEVIRRRRGVS
jgi:hypothetical protein